ncbi:hypothetical protein HDV05_005581 [Chytridiales sp. JEL 0842]|nr:hypothetical protein HDV05_005581 [Chytridiales sp. JEL 0842]
MQELLQKPSQINTKSKRRPSVHEVDIANAPPPPPEAPDTLGISMAELKELLALEKKKKRQQLHSKGLHDHEPGKVCMYCHQLKFQNKAILTQPPDFVKAFAHLKLQTNTVILKLVDALDLPSSLVQNLDDFVGTGKRCILVVNKVDALPTQVSLSRLTNWVKRETKRLGLPDWEDVVLISAKKDIGIDHLLDSIQRCRPASWDIHLVGRPNVGKSELLNALHRRASQGLESDGFTKVTTSIYPGTTVGKIQYALSSFGDLFTSNNSDLDPSSKSDEHPAEEQQQQQEHTPLLVDTPGIFNHDQLTTILNDKELQISVPNKQLKLKEHQLPIHKSLFIGGLVRIDLLEAEEETVSMGVCFNNKLPIHISRTNRAEMLYERHAGKNAQILFPPIGEDRQFPPLSLVKEFTITDAGVKQRSVDVAVGGMGFVSVLKTRGKARFAVWSVGGIGVRVRPTFLKDSKVGKGKSG